ncbi:MAG: hypothetical protein ACI8T1_002218 [Verrucomicrobiales bacterium]
MFVLHSRCVSPRVVTLDPLAQQRLQFGYRVVFVHQYLFVLHATPEPFDQHVVHPTSTSVHAYLRSQALHGAEPLDSCELAALIRVDDRRDLSGNAHCFVEDV